MPQIITQTTADYHAITNFENEVINNTRNIIFVSHSLLNSIEPRIKKYGNFEVIHLGIEPRKLINNYTIGSKESNTKYIIATGRLSRVKGFYESILAFSIIKKNNDNIKLKIIGEGEEKERLMKRCC